MEFRRIQDTSTDAWDKMVALYEDAFPLCERRCRADFEKVLADPRFYCMFLYDGGEMPIGFLTWWEAEEFLYMEHFATLPHLRGNGYGREALEIIKKTGRLLLLEAEMPEDELTARRVGFYTRAGFLINSHRHFQPPYHGEETLLEMRVLTYPREFTAEEYCRAYGFIQQVVTGKKTAD